MRFTHDVDLPQSIGMGSFEPYHPFDRRQSDSTEMMTRQDSPDGLAMNEQLEMALDETS